MHLKRFLSGIFILLILTHFSAHSKCDVELNRISTDTILEHYSISDGDRIPVRKYHEMILKGMYPDVYFSVDGHSGPTYFNKIENPKNTTKKTLTASKNFADYQKEAVSTNPKRSSQAVYQYAAIRTYLDCMELDGTDFTNQTNNANKPQQSQSNNSSQSQNQSHPPDSLQARQIQQNMKEAQQQAQQNQQRVDQARQGKRKTHDPAAEAHDCIEVDTKSLYGGFKNKCSYPVSYGYCVNNPRKGAWTDSTIFSCAGMAAGKPTAGGQSISANGYDVNHTKGGDSIYYFACKKPAYAMDLTVVIGQGIQGRCGTIGGN